MRYALTAWPAHSLLIELSAYFIFKSADHTVHTFYPVTRSVLFLIAPFSLDQCSEN